MAVGSHSSRLRLFLADCPGTAHLDLSFPNFAFRPEPVFGFETIYPAPPHVQFMRSLANPFLKFSTFEGPSVALRLLSELYLFSLLLRCG
jgi:hypothetical protein